MNDLLIPVSRKFFANSLYPIDVIRCDDLQLIGGAAVSALVALTCEYLTGIYRAAMKRTRIIICDDSLHP